MGKSVSNSPIRPAVKDQLLAKESEVRALNPGEKGARAFQPPDGGWGWVVCFAAFWTNGTIFGIMNCFGVLFVKLKDKFSDTHEEAAFVTCGRADFLFDNQQTVHILPCRFQFVRYWVFCCITIVSELALVDKKLLKRHGEREETISIIIAWVGSVSIGMTFLLSPVASILTDKLGIRTTSFIGGLMATAGMLLSSFVSSLELMYLTYGVLLGSGASLAYTPSLVVLGHYFHRRLGFVNGIVTAGSSVFTMIMPLLLTYLLDTIDLSATLQILSLIMGSLMLCSLTFRPLIVQHQRISENEAHSSEESLQDTGCCGKFLVTSIWKNKKYLLWVFAIPMALFGYFVPYVHLVQHVKDTLPDANGEVLVTCIGLTSGVGRIFFGKLADVPSVNRIMLQQLAFLSIGVLTMVLVVARNFVLLIIVCLLMGLFDGCFISLLGPIAFDVVGQKGASQAIGFLLGFCSIPLTVGPPVAGLLYDHMKNYNVAFFAAGVPPIFGALLLCLIHRIKDNQNVDLENALPVDIKDIVPDLITSNEISDKAPEKVALTEQLNNDNWNTDEHSELHQSTRIKIHSSLQEMPQI